MNPIELAIDILEKDERTVLLVGPNEPLVARRAEELAKLLGAATVLTPDAMALISSEKTLGVFSFGSSETGRRVVGGASTVLALCALSEFQCRSGKGLEGKTVIHVTPDPTHIGRNLTPAVALVGSPAEIIAALLAALRVRLGRARKAWFKSLLPYGRAARGGPMRRGVIHPVAAIQAIEAALPARSRVCLDVTSGSLHGYEHLRVTTAQRVFSSIEESACMTEALLASIGIRLASGLPTLVITGDWCQCMAPAEIHTAVEQRIGRYVVVVWSNGGGAFIGEGIKQQKIPVSGAAWRWHRQPNFALWGQAFGAVGVRATDAVTLEAAVREGLQSRRPTVVDAIIDPSIPVPAGDRFLTLSQAHG